MLYQCAISRKLKKTIHVSQICAHEMRRLVPQSDPSQSFTKNGRHIDQFDANAFIQEIFRIIAGSADLKQSLRGCQHPLLPSQLKWHCCARCNERGLASYNALLEINPCTADLRLRLWRFNNHHRSHGKESHGIMQRLHGLAFIQNSQRAVVKIDVISCMNLKHRPTLLRFRSKACGKLKFKVNPFPR